MSVRTWWNAVDELLGSVERAAWGARDAVERADERLRRVRRDWEALCADGRALGAELARWPARSERLAANGWLLAQVAASYRLHAITSAFLPAETAAARLEALHALHARRLREAGERRGGGLVKVGQLLSARPDLLPAPWIEELARLRDGLPAVPFDEIRRTIEDDLGAPLGALFASFDPEPIGSASIAQVHRAHMPDGRPVAVKVRRPGVEAVLDLDLGLLEGFLGSLRSLLPAADWDTIAAELRTGLSAELDFAREAQVMDRVATFFADHPGIRVPPSVPERCSERVLTSRFESGRRIADALADWEGARSAGDAEAGASIDATLGLLLEAYVRQVLEAGVFQADPHPGNLLVTDRGEIVVLDFGCSQILGADARERYRALLRGFVAGERAEVAAQLDALGFATRSGRPDTLLGFADALLLAFRRMALEGGAAWVEPERLVAQARALLRAAEQDPVVRIPEEFVMLGRVFGTLAGLFQHHRPRIDFARHVLPVLVGALGQRS